MSAVCPVCGSDEIKDGQVFRTMCADGKYVQFSRARCRECNENLIGVTEYRIVGGTDYIRREDLKPMYGIIHGRMAGRWA